MEINEDQPDEESKGYLFLACYILRESATITCILANSRAGRGERKLYSGKKGRQETCALTGSVGVGKL